jgi:hypothetical protein
MKEEWEQWEERKEVGAFRASPTELFSPFHFSVIKRIRGKILIIAIM